MYGPIKATFWDGRIGSTLSFLSSTQEAAGCLAGQRAMFRTEDIAGFFFRVGILMRMLKETELIFQLQDAQDTLVDQ